MIYFILFILFYFILFYFIFIQFLGLHQTHELILRITKTNVTNLPNGMLRYLSGIRYMTVDLRNNKLTSLKPEVFMLPFNEKENYYHLRNLNLAGKILFIQTK